MSCRSVSEKPRWQHRTCNVNLTREEYRRLAKEGLEFPWKCTEDDDVHSALNNIGIPDAPIEPEEICRITEQCCTVMTPENPMVFSSVVTSNVIRICNNTRWQQYQVGPGGNIRFLTADVKRRILYWATKSAFFSLALNGKKTVVNLSQKFEKGLVYEELLQQAVTLGINDIMNIRVHDGQIIFAAYNWGLMKFDVETNRRLYSLKNNSDVTKYDPTFSLLNMDVCGNETCLYWLGLGEAQISRYFINSNINQILVQRFPKEWTPWAVYQKRIYWTDITFDFFTTDMNIDNKEKFISERLTNIDYFILGGIMYYSYKRQFSSQFLKTIYPMKSYLSYCPISHVDKLIGIPASHPSTYNHQNVNDDGDQSIVEDVDDDGEQGDVDNDDQDVDDSVKSGVWSTIGWSLGIASTLIILVIICFRLVKMVRNRVRETNPNPVENVYTLSTPNVTHDQLYKDFKIQSESESHYTEVTG